MKIIGALLGGFVVAGLYFSWGLDWKSVIVLGVIGVVMIQVSHAKDWREIFTVAGSVCLFVAVVGTLLLLLQLFMGGA